MPNRAITVGIPCEIMPYEGRVPIFPSSIRQLVMHARALGRILHVVVQKGLGSSLGMTDEMWTRGGARIDEKESLYAASDVILKIKQPFSEEVFLYHEGQVSACFHHMAANRNVVAELVKKQVRIVPFEYHRPGLSAMSAEAGRQVSAILDRVCGKEWAKEDIFFGGARGVACQHAIFRCHNRGVPFSRIHACDIVAGTFVSPKMGMSYETFSSKNTRKLLAELRKCRVLILAAASSSGGVRFLKFRHLDNFVDGAVIIQISIDEGGNIDDPAFQQVTYWDNPSYEVVRTGKKFTVCNIPNIPGCLAPYNASLALEKANFLYYANILASFPDINPELLYTIP